MRIEDRLEYEGVALDFAGYPETRSIYTQQIDRLMQESYPRLAGESGYGRQEMERLNCRLTFQDQTSEDARP